MDEDVLRRTFLTGSGTVGVIAIAGCSDLGGETDDGARTEEPDEEPDNEPPEIVDAAAELVENGTAIEASMEGREPVVELETAKVRYGDTVVEEDVAGDEVTVDVLLEDIHEADLEEAPGAIEYILTDTEGARAEEEIAPHGVEPSVHIETSTRDPGELILTIDVSDEEGLHYVEGIIGDDGVVEELVGQRDAEVEAVLDADELDGITPGESNIVRATARNTVGTTATASDRQYVREFEPLEDKDVEIGAFYLPFFDDSSQWRECTDAEPEIGRYSMSDAEAVSRHADLMQGFGISRMMHQFTVPDNSRDLLRTLDDSMAGEMPLEVYYNWSNAMSWRGDKTVVEQFEDTTSFIQRNFLDRESYNTKDGRPVVTIWDVTGPAWAGPGNEVYDAIHSEWGGYEGFADFLYNSLETNGERPYLVGMMNGVPDGGVPADEGEMLKQFDATTNWFFHIESEERIDWSDAVEKIDQEYSDLQSFAESNNMDFIPTSYLGFDDRSNDCWGEDRVVERAPSHLEDSLHLAKIHGNTNRINIASFNDWPEGHMVEPGEFRGENHETEYLEVVKEFATGGVG